MAILKINNVSPGVKRPIRAEDLQDIWNGLNDALASDAGGIGNPRIISGFNKNPDNTLTKGVLAFEGKLYYYNAAPGNIITLGQYIYANDNINSDDSRTFEDGTLQQFSFIPSVTISPTSKTIGFINEDLWSIWKTPYIGQGVISDYNIFTGGVSNRALGANSVTTSKIAALNVTSEKIANGAVGLSKLSADVRAGVPFLFSVNLMDENGIFGGVVYEVKSPIDIINGNVAYEKYSISGYFKWKIPVEPTVFSNILSVQATSQVGATDTKSGSDITIFLNASNNQIEVTQYGDVNDMGLRLNLAVFFYPM